MSTTATLFKGLCGISLVLGLIPLVWHVKNNNVPAIALILWCTLYNLCSFANAFIWPDDNTSAWWDGQIFCDVQCKLFIAAFAGQLGAIAAISRNLATIMSDDISVVRTKAVRRREMCIDLALCLGIAVWMMAVHYVVQPVRYYIMTFTGCTVDVDNSWPSIVLLFIWPPIAALTAAYYAGLVLFRLHRYRKRFSEILNTHGSFTKSRFFRLFLLALIIVILYLPLTLYTFALNLSVPRLPYSWRLVHSAEWGYILKIPTNGKIQFDRWVPIGVGILLFAFFGLGSDAVAMYRGWAKSLKIDRFLPAVVMGTNVSRYGAKGSENWSNTTMSGGSSDQSKNGSWLQRTKASAKKVIGTRSLDGSTLASSCGRSPRSKSATAPEVDDTVAGKEPFSANVAPIPEEDVESGNSVPVTLSTAVTPAASASASALCEYVNTEHARHADDGIYVLRDVAVDPETQQAGGCNPNVR